jgi:hypothetical protein
MWKDANGREWSTAINVTTVKRVQELTGLLLTDAADTDLIERLYGDVVLLCNISWAVCQPVAEARGITSEQFGELLTGDVIDRACESLMEDLVGFFPSRRREIVQRIWQAARRLETERVKLVEGKLTTEQIEEMIRRTVEMADAEIDRRLAALGDGYGSSRASSVSTPPA